ncbi:transposase [Enterococcus sp. AZ012]|uniref:transposase n=1 Tax=unclassified Enterococcus TaxID=2608891 RepID=UPI003D28A159
MKRKSFIQEFKREAVILVLNEGLSVQTVSKKLEFYSNSIYRWIQEYEKHRERAFPGRGSMNSFVEMKLHASKKRING